MKQMLKLSFTLAAYTVAACAALAVVYNFTAPVIKEVKLKKTRAALQKIFPDADDFEEISSKLPAGQDKIKFQNAYLAKNGGKAAGLTVTASGATYAYASILIGINLNGTVKTIEFLELTDTPGLGSRAAEEPFIGQFTGKSFSDAFIPGADITAISGATITSKGVSAIIKAGMEAAAAYMKETELFTETPSAEIPEAVNKTESGKEFSAEEVPDTFEPAKPAGTETEEQL